VVLHSKQLISRFEDTKTSRPRLLSTLARQLERYRELLPVWIEQRKAVDYINTQTEQTLSEHQRKATFLLQERERLDAVYNKKTDALAEYLRAETAKAAAETEARRAELQEVLKEEQEVTERLRAEQAKKEALQTTLDQTMARLSSVRAELGQCQAAMAKLIGVPAATVAAGQHSSQGLRVEALRHERDQVRAQTEAVRKVAARHQEEAAHLRQQVEKMEDFLRRLTTDPSYAIDKKTKREGLRLLQMPAKLG